MLTSVSRLEPRGAKSVVTRDQRRVILASRCSRSESRLGVYEIVALLGMGLVGLERAFGEQRSSRNQPVTQLKLLARLTSPVPLYFGHAW